MSAKEIMSRVEAIERLTNQTLALRQRTQNNGPDGVGFGAGDGDRAVEGGFIGVQEHLFLLFLLLSTFQYRERYIHIEVRLA